MNVSEYLEVQFISLELKARTKEEAINELASLVKDSPAIVDYDRFLKDVFEREGMMSTGIGNNVAVPHARTDAVNKLMIAMGRSSSGIDFDSIDKEPVNLIFLMGTSSRDMASYLKLLANLSRLLLCLDFRKSLLNAKSEQEIIEIFASKENIFEKDDKESKIKGI